MEEADEIGVLVTIVLHELLHCLGEQPAVGVEVVVDDDAVAAREARMDARAGRNLALERDGDRLVRDGELDLHMATRGAEVEKVESCSVSFIKKKDNIKFSNWFSSCGEI